MALSLIFSRPEPAGIMPADFLRAERLLGRLIEAPDLKAILSRAPWIAESVEQIVDSALAEAYDRTVDAPAAHLFLQRTLYAINRLTLFWYDGLHAYENDRSPLLLGLRDRIEEVWQEWELEHVDRAALLETNVEAALLEWTARDLDPDPGEAGLYFRDRATPAAYRHMVKIGSLDGLVEASQLSRTLGGVGNVIHATLTRLFLEEYGGGRPAKKHSAYYRVMLDALGIDATPEAHVRLVPWEVLSGINHSFLLSDRKRLFLRYVGGLLYTEVSVPAAFHCYRAAAERLGLPPDAMTYWDIHIKEDARHGPWMLEDVALPLAARYPDDAWEILLGYDQQRAMSARAGVAVARAAQKFDSR